MPLAEGVQAEVAYKAYATGVITSNTEPDPATDPGASGAQVLRRTSCTLNLGKDTFSSSEIRSDRQVGDFRHGTRKVEGAISGELSPSTYADFLEAAFRGDWSAAAVTATEADFTSAAADNATLKFTFGGGDPVTKGFRVGDVIRFTDLSDTDNNGKNFLITAFGGTSNREVTVWPAPDTMSADTAFSVTTAGRSLYVPSTGHVSRKFAVQVSHEDLDIARLFTECRVGGFKISLPASGMGSVEFSLLGRNAVTYEGASAPFFTSPTPAGTTGIVAAVNGRLMVGGVAVGVITGLEMGMDLSASASAVIGQTIIPEVFLGTANVTGQMTAFFENTTLLDNFQDEDEVSILLYLTTTSAANSPAITLYIPRVKFTGATLPIQGQGEQVITLPFQALLYAGATPGVVATTIRITDTEVS